MNDFGTDVGNLVNELRVLLKNFKDEAEKESNLTQFKALLHEYGAKLDSQDYQLLAGRLLHFCIDENAIDFAKVVLNANDDMVGNLSQLDYAASTGKIAIYEAIEEKIKSDSQFYDEYFNEMVDSSKWQQYLEHAIEQKEYEFAKMIIKKYPLKLADEDQLTMQDYLEGGETLEEVFNNFLKGKFTPDLYYKKKIEELFRIIDYYPKVKDQEAYLKEFKNAYENNDIYFKENYSSELLMDCISIKNVPIAKLLLSLNAEIISPHLMSSPLDLCVSNGLVEVFESIEERITSNPRKYEKFNQEIVTGKKLVKYLQEAVSHEDHNLIKMLLNKYYVFYEQQSKAEKLPELIIPEETLKQWILDQDKETIKKALLIGADFPIYNNKGSTPKELFRNAESIKHITQELMSNRMCSVLELLKLKQLDSAVLQKFLSTIANNDRRYLDLVVAIANDINDETIDKTYREKLADMSNEFIFTNLPWDVEASLQQNIFARLSNKKTTSLFLSALSPALYDQFINDMYQMIFLKELKKSEPNEFPEQARDFTQKTAQLFKTQKVNIVYNNDGYFKFSPQNTPLREYSQGKPLTWKNVPIGYNAYLPQGPISGVMVEAYGGYDIKDFDKHLESPENSLSKFHNYLLNNGVAIIRVNLPDIKELDVSQLKMPASLHDKIHHCLEEIGKTFKLNPQTLSLRLIRLRNKPFALYGESFGGRTAVRQAELHSDSFDKYISHDGALSSNAQFLSDLPILTGKRSFLKHLDPAQEKEMAKIEKPILIMQNRDDNNVNAKIPLDFYKKMKKLNKSHLIKLCFSNIGNPAPKDDKLNKGHFHPTQEEDLVRYCETIFQFVAKESLAIPALSQWRAYKEDKTANQYYVAATLEQKFISQALEILTSLKEKYNAVNAAAWKNKLQPLYYSLYYANELAKFPEKLVKETKRLADNQLLTDEVIINTLKGQAQLFYQYVQELYPEIKWPDKYTSELLETKGTIAKFREVIKNISQEDPKFIAYFLSTLYQNNIQLLQPLYADFKKDPELEKLLELAKQKLDKTINKERRHIVNVWQQVAKVSINRQQQVSSDLGLEKSLENSPQKKR